MPPLIRRPAGLTGVQLGLGVGKEEAGRIWGRQVKKVDTHYLICHN